MISEKSVNPENIQWGDIISTRFGLARAVDVREMEGTLDYCFLSAVFKNGKFDSNTPVTKDCSIRLTHLISKFVGPGQLNLPFVQESIEKAIRERNIQLEKTKQEIIAKSMAKSSKGKQGRKKKVLSKEKILLEALISKCGGVDALLNELTKK